MVRRRTEVAHQQRVSRYGSSVIECTFGESRQCSPLTFVLEEDILNACSNKNDV